MKRSFLSWSTAALLAVAGAALAPVLLNADDNNGPVAVTVSFGAGLNTAQPGNSANHHVLPNMIHVQAGGVVNFNVAGFHQIYVYNPGKGPEDVHPADPTALFMDDKAGLYYEGLKTGGGPPPGIPVTTNPSNASNRLESVSFSKPGKYLVICNVAPHFADGMWAWIHVTGKDK
jgi:plastocyanin